MQTINQSELKDFRIKAGLTCKRLAVILGCSAPLVNMVETGKKRFGKTLQARFLKAFEAEIVWTNGPRWSMDRARELVI